MTDSDNDWEGQDRRRASSATGLERHLQTVLTAVAAALLIWLGNAMLDLIREQVRTTEQVKNLSSKIDDNSTWRQDVEKRLSYVERKIP